MRHPVPTGERDLRTAIKRGARGDCPACGQAVLFGAYLKPAPHCPACGQSWQGHQADDMPAYLVILLLGHVIVPIMVAVNLRYDPPTWIQMLGWPALAALLALLLIQPAKGMVIGFQWARRMHGFAGER